MKFVSFTRQGKAGFGVVRNEGVVDLGARLGLVDLGAALRAQRIPMSSPVATTSTRSTP